MAMQQHFLIANLDRLESLDPSALGGGCNFWSLLTEGRVASVLALLTTHTNSPLPHDPEFDHQDVVGVFGRWAGNRIAILGDCHMPERETDPSLVGLPSYSQVQDTYLEISGIIPGAWNRLAEDTGLFMPPAGENRALTEKELVALVAGQTELRSRSAALAARRTGYGRYVVASSAGGGKEYVVTLQEDNVTCSCPVYQGKKQLCKHVVRAGDYALQTGTTKEIL